MTLQAVMVRFTLHSQIFLSVSVSRQNNVSTCHMLLLHSIFNLKNHGLTEVKLPVSKQNTRLQSYQK